MSRKPSILVEPLRGHPAACAWASLGEAAPAAVERWRLATRTKPALYRLTFPSSGPPPVFAKRDDEAGLALERTVYEEILPRLPLTTPRCRGYHRSSDGSAWLFVEDVGYRRLFDEEPEHRALAARWLGLLHGSAAGLAAASRLPDAGPARYLGHLRRGREAVRRSFANPGLSVEDRAVLTGILDQLDVLEARWDELEGACEGLPRTLVHGDFRSKNVRLCEADGAPAVMVIDWEMTGWGIPAADLGGTIGRRMTIAIEPRVYQETLQECGWNLDAAAIHRLSVLGRIFQGLAAVEWATASLGFESPRYLLKPVSSLQVYQKLIAQALDAWEERTA